MSRILVVGDTHFRYTLPYASALPDGRKGEWEAVKNKIIEVSKSCDAVVILGDLFNQRHNHSSVIRELVEFLKSFGNKHIYIISGNHDRFSSETALDFLQKADLPGVHVFTEPTSTVVIGKTETIEATFLPYMTPGTLGAATLEEANEKVLEKLPGGDALFHHHVVSGTVWQNMTSEHLNEIVLPKEAVEKKYQWIIGGHIHEAQKLSPQTYVTGNIFTHEIGEIEKCIWILDTEEQQMEEIALPVRQIREANWKGDEHSLVHIPNQAIVRCVVTKKGTDLNAVKKALRRFDASIIVEKYPNEREKVGFDEATGLDLSIDGMLKVYAGAKKVSYEDLKEAMELIN